MAIPASEQWTALFLPQLLFAADPERLYSGGPAPRALLIEDRIAARNREAVRLGVRRCMNAKEALLQTPALQLERSGQLVGQELSSILLSIAQSFGAALLLQAPNSGAAAIIVHADQSALQQLLDTVLRLKFEAFGGSGSSPQNALSAAVKEAQSVQADYDAQALLMHTVLKENLIAKPAPETFRLRIGVPSFNFKLQLERLEAAFAAWTKTVKTNAVSCTIRAYDPVGRILHTSSVLGGNLLIPIGKSAAAGRIRLHKLLYKAVLEEQAANLELEVVPFRQTADGEAATSPLVRSLTQIVGRSRVYQLALTGDLRPEAAQQHVPALNLSGSAHQRERCPHMPISFRLRQPIFRPLKFFLKFSHCRPQEGFQYSMVRLNCSMVLNDYHRQQKILAGIIEPAVQLESCCGFFKIFKTAAGSCKVDLPNDDSTALAYE